MSQFLRDAVEQLRKQDIADYGSVEKAQQVRRAPPHFADRGFSDRTIKALVTADILYPETVLFMAPAELKTIEGISKRSLSEIEAYRRRFRLS